MKVKLTGVVMMVFLALTGCQGREKSADLTGSYGVGVVTGQVVAAEGVTSPAGVEVSVRGTGMRTVLAADGQFGFAGMPENATLDFRRPADGVQASMLLEQASGHVVIELTKSEAVKAKKSGRRRAARPGERLWELEGVIRTAGAGSIVLFTSKQVEQTIGLLPETVIRKGNLTLTPADLLVDTRVHVKARKVDETTFNAVLIIVQDEDDDEGEDDEPATVRQYEGTVVSAGVAELVVFTSKKQEVTFVLTADTIIRKGNKTVLPAEILSGQRVHVKATASAGGATNTATRVTIQNTNATVRVNGTVTAVGAADLTVQTPAGTVTVQTDAATQIRKKGVTIALADIAAGDTVKVEGTSVALNTVVANQIDVKSK